MTTVTRHTDTARKSGTSQRRNRQGESRGRGCRVGVHEKMTIRSPEGWARRLGPVLAEASVPVRNGTIWRLAKHLEHHASVLRTALAGRVRYGGL